MYLLPHIERACFVVFPPLPPCSQATNCHCPTPHFRCPVPPQASLDAAKAIMAKRLKKKNKKKKKVRPHPTLFSSPQPTAPIDRSANIAVLHSRGGTMHGCDSVTRPLWTAGRLLVPAPSPLQVQPSPASSPQHPVPSFAVLPCGGLWVRPQAAKDNDTAPANAESLPPPAAAGE